MRITINTLLNKPLFSNVICFLKPVIWARVQAATLYLKSSVVTEMSFFVFLFNSQQLYFMDLMTWEDISSLEKMTRSNLIPKNYQTVWHLLYMIFWFQIVRRKFTEFLENYYCTKKPIICTTSCLWRALDTLLFCRLAFPHLSKIQISLETSG